MTPACGTEAVLEAVADDDDLVLNVLPDCVEAAVEEVEVRELVTSMAPSIPTVATAGCSVEYLR